MAWRALRVVPIIVKSGGVNTTYSAWVLKERIILGRIVLREDGASISSVKTPHQNFFELGIAEEFIPNLGMVVELDGMRGVVTAMCRVDEKEWGDEIGAYEITVQIF